MAVPNVYQLHAQHLSITYSTSGFAGRPSFEYQDAHQMLTFRDDEIRTADSEIGTLVTVTIRRTVDAGSTSFTLLLPRVNVAGPNQQAHIVTEGITTLHKFSIIPGLNQGQMELYMVTRLTGTAELLIF
jgi:hypothetical protein